MPKRNQFFVRATTPTGKVVSADIMDLDEESFRAFVVDVMYKYAMIVGIRPDLVEGEQIQYRTKEEKH